MSIPTSGHLAAVERHPEWERLRRRRPSTVGRQFALGCGVLFGIIFIAFGLVVGGVVQAQGSRAPESGCSSAR